MSYVLVRQEDPENLIGFTSDPEIQAAFETSNGKTEQDSLPFILKGLITSLKACETLRRTLETQNSEKLERAFRSLKARTIKQVQDANATILKSAYEESRTSCTDADLDETTLLFSTRLVNYDEITRRLIEIQALSHEVQTEVSACLDDSESEYGDVATLIEESLVATDPSLKIEPTLKLFRDQLYSDPSIRLLDTVRRHATNARRVHEKAYVIETKTTVENLNRIHSKAYGRHPNDAIGMALGGPPGLGKTAILSYYIKQVLGVDPVQVDVDPGQNAFTLMAKPVIAEVDPIANIQRRIDQIEALDPEELKAMFDEEPTLAHQLEIDLQRLKEDPDGVKKNLTKNLRLRKRAEMRLLISSAHEQGAYTYGPIYDALKQNRPIIINEVQRLRNSDFLHSLATAIPATDREAGPMPSYVPNTEGEDSTKQPKGWFYSTITGQWIRVPENFRLFFTGNLGAEFGNQGLAPALSSRLEGRTEKMVPLPPREQAEILWAWLSNSDGTLQIDAETANLVYILITKVIPQIESQKLEKNVRNQKAYFSIRSLISMALILTEKGVPIARRTKPSLEDAIYATMIAGEMANEFRESLKVVVPALYMTGFISDESIDKVEKAAPGLKAGELKVMGQSGSKIPKIDPAKEKGNKFEGKCLVCGVHYCPMHTTEILDQLDQLKTTASLREVGISEKALSSIRAWNKKLAGLNHWKTLIQHQLPGAPMASLMEMLDIDELDVLESYIETELKEKVFTKKSTNINTISTDLKFITRCKELGFNMNPLNKRKLEIESTVQECLDQNLSAYKDSSNEEKLASSKERKAIKIISMADAIGLDIDVSRFTSLKAALVLSVKDEVQKINEEAVPSQKIDILMSTLNKVEVLLRHYPDDETSKEIIRNLLFNKAIVPLINTILMTNIAEADSAIRRTAQSGAAGKNPKTATATMPTTDASLLNTGLLGRTKVLEFMNLYRNCAEKLDAGKHSEKTLNDITTLAVSWANQNNAEIVEDAAGVSMYIDFLAALHKTNGDDILTMIKKLNKERITAPVMRTF